MKNLTRYFLFIPLFFSSSLEAQILTLPADSIKKNLKQHISILASDDFEGRETGSEGEKKAYQYLSDEFNKLGLKPMGNQGFLQPFMFTRGKLYGEGTVFMLNGKKYHLHEDYVPVNYPYNGMVNGLPCVKVGYGISAPELKYNNYKKKRFRKKIMGKVFVMELSTPDGISPHSKFAAHASLSKRVELALKHGANAVIFVNSDKNIDKPEELLKEVEGAEIPVVFAKGMAYKTLMDGTVAEAVIGVDTRKDEATGHNVAALLDNNAFFTVVIGAHYDHLGWGSEGSLHREGRAIHNGADDNASGTAALIELARMLQLSEDKRSNYLFVAFSGEERGLLGSKFFVKNSPVEFRKMSYMLNMDMVGRLKPVERVLIINGTGTSPKWDEALKTISVDSIKIKTSEGGIGPSDHTSFYLDSIPAIHFFSGTHPDYHKPGDDENKINYDGQISIMKIMLSLIHELNDDGKIPFTKTKDTSMGDTPRFKVTLGVVPDYTFEGEGMRIDGVTEGKPASKAGLQRGDIVIQLGDHKVFDMTSYMKALGMFNKGDTAIAKVKRGTDVLDVTVTF